MTPNTSFKEKFAFGATLAPADAMTCNVALRMRARTGVKLVNKK